jgi:hypothetical protein
MEGTKIRGIRHEQESGVPLSWSRLGCGTLLRVQIVGSLGRLIYHTESKVIQQKSRPAERLEDDGAELEVVFILHLDDVVDDDATQKS